jgi:phosphate:Na+ symporter
MFRKIFLPIIFLLLAYGFWISPDFKVITAGIAIFLLGMLSLERGFRAFAGGILEKILQVITDKLWKRLGFGLLATMLMQSSSLVSVLTISFLSAGLLDLVAGIGIVFGANLGTTTSVWLVAGFGVKVNISAYAMPMLVFGVILILQKSRYLQGLGYILSGVGFLFLGIHFMKEGFEAFRETFNLAEYAVPGLRGLLIYVLLGIAATVIIQSSDATMVLIITALSVQQISYENSLALAIGANIGTTITAIIGSISANVQGKRLAAAHLFFNCLTACIALLFINQFVWLVDYFSEAVGIASNDYTLKLAAFHSLFNLVGIILLLPWVNGIASVLQKLFKEKLIKVDKPRYLNKAVMNFPDTMVEAVRQETVHLYQNGIHIILKALGLSRKTVFSDRDLEDVLSRHQNIPEYNIDAAYDRNIKSIYSAIIAFISQVKISSDIPQSSRLFSLREANRSIVAAIKACKHLQKNLYRVALTQNQNAIGEYNKIRLQLALLMREIEAFRLESVENELPVLSLDSLKAMVEEHDQQMNQAIDALIREHNISPEIGTSIINDSAYMYEIKQRLITLAETVFVVLDSGRVKAEKQLALNKTELLEVLNPESENKPGI